MDAAVIVSLVGALGLGSIIERLVGGGRQRRELRAQVLAALAECERVRWVTLPRDQEADRFGAAMSSFEVAALVARVPRSVVGQYSALSWAAYSLSFADAERRDGRGAIDARFADLVRGSATLCVGCVWRPWWTRLSVRRRIDAINGGVEAIADNDVQVRVRLGRERAGLA